MREGFEFIETDDDYWYEQRIAVGNNEFAIVLSPDEKPFNASLPYAKAVVADADGFIRALKTFLLEAANQKEFRPFATELAQLKVETVTFTSKSQPAAAEIAFQSDKDWEQWLCAYSEGRFFNLLKN